MTVCLGKKVIKKIKIMKKFFLKILNFFKEPFRSRKAKRFWLNYYKDCIVGDDIVFELYTSGEHRPNSALKIPLNAIKKPTYGSYFLVREIQLLYIWSHGSSAAASQHSSHYSNALTLLGAITDIISLSKFNKWNNQFKKEMASNPKFCAQ